MAGRRKTAVSQAVAAAGIAAFGVSAMFTLVTAAAAQEGPSAEERERRVQAMLQAPNPLEPSTSVWIEDLTYMEVRDRIRDGVTIALIPTGGIEQNGPYLVTGKHNVMLQSLCPAVATTS